MCPCNRGLEVSLQMHAYGMFSIKVVGPEAFTVMVGSIPILRHSVTHSRMQRKQWVLVVWYIYNLTYQR